MSHDTFSPVNIRRLYAKARAETGYTQERQQELTELIRSLSSAQFDAYYAATPDYRTCSVSGDTEETYYASLVAWARNEYEHYQAVMAWRSEAER